MRVIVAVVVGVLTCPLARADETPSEVKFAKADVGKVPAGWAVAKTGTGDGSLWKIVADDTTPSGSGFALAQTADGPTQMFNLCVLTDSAFKDGEVSTAVRALAGKVDQGGGLVWRYQDANNYYVCRYNPLEENLRVYYVKGGKRTQLATKENVELPAGKWFTVSVKHAGDRVECSLNGTKYLEVTDKTFAEAGKVGVWSKADAQSHFDRVRFTPFQK